MTIFEISRNQYKRKQQQKRSILKQNELFHNKSRIMPFLLSSGIFLIGVGTVSRHLLASVNYTNKYSQQFALTTI